MSPDQKPKGTLRRMDALWQYRHRDDRVSPDRGIWWIWFGLSVSYQTVVDDRRFHLGFGGRLS